MRYSEVDISLFTKRHRPRVDFRLFTNWSEKPTDCPTSWSCVAMLAMSRLHRPREDKGSSSFMNTRRNPRSYRVAMTTITGHLTEDRHVIASRTVEAPMAALMTAIGHDRQVLGGNALLHTDGTLSSKQHACFTYTTGTHVTMLPGTVEDLAPVHLLQENLADVPSRPITVLIA